MYVTSKSGRIIYIVYMERRAGLGGRLVVAGFTGACQNASLGWRPASGGGRRGRLSAQQGDLISGPK